MFSDKTPVKIPSMSLLASRQFLTGAVKYIRLDIQMPNTRQDILVNKNLVHAEFFLTLLTHLSREF